MVRQRPGGCLTACACRFGGVRDRPGGSPVSLRRLDKVGNKLTHPGPAGCGPEPEAARPSRSNDKVG